MPRANKKQTAESALLLALQNEHGYMLHDVPKSQRVTLVFGEDPKRPGKKTITANRVVQLVVPMDSALATAMTKAARAQDKAKPAKAGAR